jgi:integrase
MPKRANDGLWRRGTSRNWYFTHEGKDVSTGTDDREAARLIRARELRKAVEPTYRAENETTVASAAERALEHLEHERRVRPKTLEMYKTKLGHVVRILGTLTLDRWQPSTTDAYIAQRHAEGAHPNTVTKDLVAISQMLKVARRDGKFTRDPKSVMPIRRSSGYEPRERFLTEEEWELLRDELAPHRAAFCAWEIAIAGRYSDVLRSKKGDADMVKGEIVVDRTKRRGSQKVIPIVAPELVDFALQHADGEGDALFSNWGKSNMWRDLRAAVKRINKKLADAHTLALFGDPPVFAPVTSNDLRRTMGSWLVQRGAQPAVVGKFMGHASAAMVEKIYGRHTAASLRALLPIVRGSRIATGTNPAEPKETGSNHPKTYMRNAVRPSRRNRLAGLWLRLSAVQARSVTLENKRFRHQPRSITKASTGFLQATARHAARIGFELGCADWAIEHDPLALLCARVAFERLAAGVAS